MKNNNNSDFGLIVNIIIFGLIFLDVKRAAENIAKII